MSRAFNFSAGPAMLPEAVMRQAQAEMLNWNNTGMSVMEMSHRSKEYMAMAQHAEQTLREIMAIPDNYKVLFTHGGASLQFSAIPLNLTRPGDVVDYIVTGVWSAKAVKEAQRYVNVNVVCENHQCIPERSEWRLSPNAKYVHYTPNETIGGIEFLDIPDVGDVPLVADMSSTILSRPIDVSKFGVIYAGAQKNIGPAGLAIVIVREDLIGQAREITPVLMNWQVSADNDSMYNTPPTYAWYLAGLVFDWIKAQGGVEAMAKHNEAKAKKLYAAIDTMSFYANPVAVSERSWMNVPFTLKDPSLDGLFLEESKQAGLLNLKGHKLVGGMRASIYNAMPEEGVDALINFMQDFAQRHG
ncbi:MAG: 3-phosphoserine/phosphohydroxythreonine transaminase [Thiomicrospira sp.]|jgi:phosphoserine aminotransferase|nr:3-phosphoserine/phosphohydroxythreonine transaminase [Thiomicrospira sp.]